MSVIYYNKLFPLFDNNTPEIYKKLKIDTDSISYISTPKFSDKITKIILSHVKDKNLNITDCTAGCGGDTISFLNAFNQVISIEQNLVRFNYLLNNIKSYNLQHKSRLFCGSFIKILPLLVDYTDVLYIDPPWGGKDYKKQKLLKLYIDDIPLETILLDYIKINKRTKHIVMKLPINYNLLFMYEKIKDYGKIYLYNLEKMFIIIIDLFI